MKKQNELDEKLPDVPASDACNFCGTSARDRRLKDSGCRFCRNGYWGKPIGWDESKELSEEETVESWKRQLAHPESHIGGVSGYCKETGMNEQYLRSLGGRI